MALKGLTNIRFIAVSDGRVTGLSSEGSAASDQPPDGAPALALGRLPAPRRPLRTQLGTPKSRASGPLFLQRCTRPGRLRRNERPRGDAVPPISTETPNGRPARARGRAFSASSFLATFSVVKYSLQHCLRMLDRK